MNQDKIVLTVKEVNEYIKNKIINEPFLRNLIVKGEISNYKLYASGHAFFSLKDNDSLISSVMFASYRNKCKFIPKNGDEVLAYGYLDLYVKSGTYQLIVYALEDLGKGNILLELEKLKNKLAKEGLFDKERKRPICSFPRALGVITAPNSAAIKDIVTNIQRRYPVADIYFFPSSVQGENAPKELLKAILTAQNYSLDTLIIGRGGGASEDLSAFNDENLVRALAKSKIPTIAAVGHEIDFTLTDFVCDKRASTPTGAAELATPNQEEIKKELAYFEMRLENALENKIKTMKENLLLSQENLDEIMNAKIKDFKQKISNLSKHLEALNPKKILQRGYSISEKEDGNVLTSINDIKVGERLKTTLKDGVIISQVEEK